MCIRFPKNTKTGFSLHAAFHLPLLPSLPSLPLLALLLCACMLALPVEAYAQRRRAPGGGARAVVVDERLAVLRDEPQFSARLVQRLGRGRMVSVLGARRASEGITFYRVAVTRRTRGWLQSEAVISPARKGDDERLLNLVRASKDFDRISRAAIFLEMFTASTRRPAVLLLLGEAAEEAAQKLTREAARRLDEDEIKANRAPAFSYFMNYNGLDRYRRQGVDFIFDVAAKQYHYDGASWREIVRRYPRSTEAESARQRLAALKK
jgi:hypothetical protein